jgi:GT2 family glycosyltransferase
MNSNLKISIIIITYNRPDDMLDLVQNIISLDHKDHLEEVIIVNNKSTADYKPVEDLLKSHPEMAFKYFIAEENFGVSRGRNFAIQKAKAPILVFIDDDALFENKDTILQIRNIFSEEKNKDAGIAAFKIYYQSTMNFQKNAFPHKEFEKRKNLNQFDTYYFSGCAHAIRRSIFETVGGYPENFFYGMEEYDLSYRTIDKGFKIIYDDRVTVLHKESPSGRLLNKDKLRGMWVNKTKTAWKYLPKKYFYSTAVLWSFQYLRTTHWNLVGWRNGWKKIFNIPSREKKNMISKQALNYLRKVKARLWY